MDLQEGLTARLLGAGAMTQIVGDRLFWVDRPQLSGLPALTLEVVFEDFAQHHGGFQSLQFASVQADAWAKTKASAKAVKDAAIATLVPEFEMAGIRFNRAFVTSRDLAERLETMLVHRVRMEFRFFYSVQ